MADSTTERQANHSRALSRRSDYNVETTSNSLEWIPIQQELLEDAIGSASRYTWHSSADVVAGRRKDHRMVEGLYIKTPEAHSSLHACKRASFRWPMMDH
jgi:hypothetical protein